MIDFNRAKEIALKVDPQVDYYSEWENGYHFILRSQMEGGGDQGFAVSKEDGEVYHGYAAHEFLAGDMIDEGDF